RRGVSNDLVPLRARECERNHVAAAWFRVGVDDRDRIGNLVRLVPGARGGETGSGRGSPWRREAGAIGESIARLADQRSALHFSRGSFLLARTFHWPALAQFRRGLFRP